jgi:glyoxylase-like metal-dependent hydrolase (beta-lactamase superfamily II)
MVHVVIVEGPDGLIVVDTSESLPTAEKYLSALRQVNKKPIKAIVLTHHHADHITGLEVSVNAQIKTII